MKVKFRPSTTIQGMIELNPHDELPRLQKSDQNLVWLDCEMTGLNPDLERIIEIAVIVTGPDLEPRIEGPVLVIHQSDELLDRWMPGTKARMVEAA